MVNVLSLIDDVIIWNDTSLLEEERFSKASSRREVHIHITQVHITQGDRPIQQSHSGSGNNVAGDENINQSHTQNINMDNY